MAEDKSNEIANYLFELVRSRSAQGWGGSNTVITLFEHQYRSYTEIGFDDEHPLIQGIEQLNQSLGKDLIILQRKGIKATQYVGVIRVGEWTLQILPKIDYHPQGDTEAPLFSILHDNAASSATRNLLFLLSYAQDLQVYEKDIAGLSHQSLDWFELLTRLLASDLHRLMQRGLAHNYILVENTLPVMRGRWRVEQQLTRRPHTKHRFDLRYDEFSPDILLNQVFRFTVDRLLFQTKDPGNRRLLSDLRDWLTPVRKKGQISSQELDQVIFTRLIDRYQPAFNLARMFIEHTTPVLTPGKTAAFAFVFDMNFLFEKFVAQFIRCHRQNIFPNRWDKMQLRIQSEGLTYHLARHSSDNQKVFRLVPDILFENLWGSNFLVIDTKYKQLNAEQRKLGVSEGDFYQMLTYLNALECPQGLILYPQAADGVNHFQRFNIENRNGQVVVATVNLRQPIYKKDTLIQEFKDLFNPLLAVSI